MRHERIGACKRGRERRREGTIDGDLPVSQGRCWRGGRPFVRGDKVAALGYPIQPSLCGGYFRQHLLFLTHIFLSPLACLQRA
jgi:hypothetical protein